MCELHPLLLKRVDLPIILDCLLRQKTPNKYPQQIQPKKTPQPTKCMTPKQQSL